jgi:hypothetical protein
VSESDPTSLAPFAVENAEQPAVALGHPPPDAAKTLGVRRFGREASRLLEETAAFRDGGSGDPDVGRASWGRREHGIDHPVGSIEPASL